MKKFLSLILVSIILATAVSCDDSGTNETRAGIIAEDFVKQDVLSEDDLDYDVVGVDKESLDEYHVVANIKTLNGLGIKVPRKASIRLRYNGNGEWSDVNNWSLISISYLDESTGESQTTRTENKDDGWEAFNDANDGETETIAGVKFNVIFKNEYSENLASDKKLSASQVKAVCKALNGKDVYFYVNGATESLADSYAHMIGGYMEYENKPLK